MGLAGHGFAIAGICQQRWFEHLPWEHMLEGKVLCNAFKKVSTPNVTRHVH